MSRTALNEAELGRRIPTNAVVRAYVTTAGGSPAEVEDWLRRVAALRARSNQPRPNAYPSAQPAAESANLTDRPELPSNSGIGHEAGAPIKSQSSAAPKTEPSWAGLPPNSSPSMRRSVNPRRRAVVFAATAAGIALTVTAGLLLTASSEDGTNPSAAAPATPTTRLLSTVNIPADASSATDVLEVSQSGSRAEIRFPPSQDRVISPMVVNGTATVATAEALWLILKGADDPIFYVTTDSAVAIDAEGRWASNLHLGRGECDEGNQYRIYAVTTPRGGLIEQEVLRRPTGQYSVRMTALPADVDVLGAVDIALGDYRGDRVC